jgi:hypothetical protein
MKYGLAVLLIAVFALGGALYATAAPGGPSNAQLAAQIVSLRNQVKILKADVSWLGGYAKSVQARQTCELDRLWMYATTDFTFVASLYRDGDKAFRPEYVASFVPKRPDCG